MNVLYCGAVPVVKIEMVAGRVESEGRETVIHEHQEDGRFCIGVPRSIGKLIQAGNVLSVLCVPVGDLTLAYETLALAKRTGGVTRIIFSRGRYWEDLWTKLV